MGAVRAALMSLAVAGLVTACTESSRRPTATTGPGTTGPGTTATDSTPTADTVTGTVGPTGSPDTLGWGPCTDPQATDPSLQCATLTVPLSRGDDGAPSGDTTIDLALVRVPATANRRGAVLFNPGGPGGSGFDSIAQGGSTISSSLGLGAYDLIGFDPRGVDRSNGIRCLTDAQLDAQAYLVDVARGGRGRLSLLGATRHVADHLEARALLLLERRRDR